jgi:hypothetical protein
MEADESMDICIPSPSEVGGKTPTGTENDNPIAFETHRYISGSFFFSSSSSSASSPSPSRSPPSPSSPSELPCAGVAAAVCVCVCEAEAGAVNVAARRLFFAWRLDCFLRRRLIVSACRVGRVIKCEAKEEMNQKSNINSRPRRWVNMKT